MSTACCGALSTKDDAVSRMPLDDLIAQRDALLAARSPSPRRAHELLLMLDAELNDFGVQLAMLGGHAADSDG